MDTFHQVFGFVAAICIGIIALANVLWHRWLLQAPHSQLRHREDEAIHQGWSRRQRAFEQRQDFFRRPFRRIHRPEFSQGRHPLFTFADGRLRDLEGCADVLSRRGSESY